MGSFLRVKTWKAFLAALYLVYAAPLLRAYYQQPNPGSGPPTSLKNLSLEELSQIEVTTPSKQPEKAFDTAAAIYTITGQDILRSGATNIPEALRLAPGVEVARIDGNKWSIGIRGFGSRLSRAVLVLVDGRTVYTPLFAGTYWEVQDTLLEDIDRIEVVRGPGGTIWGPNAVNGVINIITKSSKDTQGDFASAGGGNEEQGFVNFRYGGSYANDLTYRFYGKAFTRSPEYHPDGRNFDDWRAAQSGFRVDWSASPRDSFTVQGDLYDEAAGESVGATSYAAPYSQTVYANAGLSGGNVNARWERKLANGGEMQIQAYYDRTNRYEPNLGERRNTFDIDFLEHIPVAGHQNITWGLGARASHAFDIEEVTGLTFVPAQRTDQLYTAFFQDEIGFLEDKLSLTLGTKLLRTNFTGFEFEPSTRLAWKPSGRQTLWAAFTHAVRTPSDVEEDFYLLGFAGIAANGTPELARFNANPKFAPEQMNGSELGYRRLIGDKLLVDIAGFYNHYHDLFDEEITGGFGLEENPPPVHLLLPAQFGNGLLGYAKGVEIAPEYRPTGFWRLRGSYSFLHMNIGKAPGSKDVGTAPGIVGSSPQHQVSVISSFDLGKTVQVDLTYRYVSELHGQNVPAYSTGDARLAWCFAPQFEIALAGQNLLQPHHPEFGGDAGPLVGIRRSAYVTVTWRR
jgi:iron complex outermembrane receptor protein